MKLYVVHIENYKDNNIIVRAKDGIEAMNKAEKMTGGIAWSAKLFRRTPIVIPTKSASSVKMITIQDKEKEKENEQS